MSVSKKNSCIGAHGRCAQVASSWPAPPSLSLFSRQFHFYCFHCVPFAFIVSLSCTPMHYDRMLSGTVISIASRLVGWNNAIDSSIDALSLDAWWCCTNAVNKLPRYIIACAFDCKRFMTRSVPSGALGGRRFAL